MDYKVIIDAGHGGGDPGAVQDGRQEKDDNLKLALAVGKILEDNGVDVVYTRTNDVYQTPFEKAKIGNENDGDLFISFHRNSSPVPNQYEGVETLIYDKSGLKNTLAENIAGALAKLGFKNLGVKERPGLVVLRRTNMPAVLIETGFINTDKDNQIFDEKFNEIAQAIAAAILGTIDKQMDSKEVKEEVIEGTCNDHQEEKPNPEKTYYRVQVGAFKQRNYADNLLYELEDKGYPAFILAEDGYYKVQVGAYEILMNAIKMEARLRRCGYSTYITT